MDNNRYCAPVNSPSIVGSSSYSEPVSASNCGASHGQLKGIIWSRSEVAFIAASSAVAGSEILNASAAADSAEAAPPAPQPSGSSTGAPWRTGSDCDDGKANALDEALGFFGWFT